jgi:Flp pilus assembly protein TadD
VSSTRLAALALVCCCAAAALTADPPAKPTKEQIAKWVEDLGSDDFATREEASKKLYEAGQAAEEALQRALGSDDAEVVRRAEEILDKFKWGLYPDAPKEVVELVKRYQGADANGKQAVIKELIAAGPTGYRSLLKIASAEPDPATRGRIFVILSTELKRVAPQLLAEEKYEALEPLLDVVLANDPKLAGGDYAAYWLLRGKLDDRIAHFKAVAGKGTEGKKNWEILSRLYRAKGDLAAAREAADKAGEAELAEFLLYEAGDWKELARRDVAADTGQEYEKFGLRAAFRRLAGDAKGCDEDLAELRKLADAAPGDDNLHFYAAKALFLNDRPAEGLDMLTKSPGHQAVAFEVLAARMNYRAALDLADKAPGDAALQILKARTLYSLGEKDKALPIFARFADQIKPANPGDKFDWHEALVDAENRVGLRDQALEHAAKVLTLATDEGTETRVCTRLFPSRGDEARALWNVVRRKHAGQDPAASMKLVRDLLEGNAPAQEVAGLIADEDQAEKAKAAQKPEDVDRWRRGLAEAALKAKDEAAARACLEKAGTAAALIRLGDLEADKKEWDKAADRYYQAWEKAREYPLSLYLSGWALTKAGKDKDGKKRMELAHWAPLGDESARFKFVTALAERNRREDAAREADLMLRLSVPGSFYAGEAVRRLSLDALDRKDYFKAADGQEKAMLRCLRGYINYVQPAAYVGVPAFVHRLRATGDAAAGKLDDARREAAAALAGLPGDTNVPIALIAELDKAGKKKEADELFDQSLAAQEKLCQDYPSCSWGHNSAAWLSACARRGLEKAQEHALKAVELAPKAAGCHDTLAEVYFQRGDKDKAAAEQKKAIEIDPKKPYYRKQLKRIEAGDPAAPRPDEAAGDDDE